MVGSGKTYVLLHGNWHGGWCWARVADGLRALGHRVFTPTLTGLGERHHLLSPSITLDTFIDDLINVIEAEELGDIILVGHSFGGLVITGAADRRPERIRHLVYLDSMIVRDGQCALDGLPPEIAASRRLAITQQVAGGIPPPDPSMFGVAEDADRDWLQRRLTPQPAHSQDSPLSLVNPVGNGLPCTYIACTDPVLANLVPSHHRARDQPGWTWLEIATGHDAMVTAPVELTRMLAAID